MKLKRKEKRGKRAQLIIIENKLDENGGQMLVSY